MGMPKDVVQLHDRILSIIKSELRKNGNPDYKTRMQAELTYSQYINPLCNLSNDVYELNIPELSTPDIKNLSSIADKSARDYKKILFGVRVNNKALISFVEAFVFAFVSKYVWTELKLLKKKCSFWTDELFKTF